MGEQWCVCVWVEALGFRGWYDCEKWYNFHIENLSPENSWGLHIRFPISQPSPGPIFSLLPSSRILYLSWLNSRNKITLHHQRPPQKKKKKTSHLLLHPPPPLMPIIQPLLSSSSPPPPKPGIYPTSHPHPPIRSRKKKPNLAITVPLSLFPSSSFPFTFSNTGRGPRGERSELACVLRLKI